MTTKARPLSPHLTIYKPQITSVLSILHRATGIALTAGILLLVWWLGALATGPEAFATVQGFVGSPIGILLMLGWSWSLMYHLLNGVRHLAWDAGWGLDLDAVHKGGWIAAGGSAALTVFGWLIMLTIAA